MDNNSITRLIVHEELSDSLAKYCSNTWARRKETIDSVSYTLHCILLYIRIWDTFEDRLHFQNTLLLRSTFLYTAFKLYCYYSRFPCSLPLIRSNSLRRTVHFSVLLRIFTMMLFQTYQVFSLALWSTHDNTVEKSKTQHSP